MKKSEMNFGNIKKPPIRRNWYKCPNCGKKLIIYDDTARSRGIYIKCKECGSEIEIKI